MVKKKKENFTSFRSNDKSAYKTFKIPLKTILCNRQEVQPVLNHLVFDINDLVTHTYQFIRLYLLHLYNQQLPLPVIDETVLKTFTNTTVW
jgi:single-stranded DNA-specific DHH superfamily exonuclease